MLLPSFICFDEHHQFAEYFRQIASIDLVNDEKIRTILVLSGLFAESKEHTISSFESAFLSRAETLNKILVAVALMELNCFRSALVFFAHRFPRRRFLVREGTKK